MIYQLRPYVGRSDPEPINMPKAMSNQHYRSNEFITAQGVLKRKKYSGPSWKNYILDFLFYISPL
jgi:hypothetical protein